MVFKKGNKNIKDHGNFDLCFSYEASHNLFGLSLSYLGFSFSK